MFNLLNDTKYSGTIFFEVLLNTVLTFVKDNSTRNEKFDYSFSINKEHPVFS